MPLHTIEDLLKTYITSVCLYKEEGKENDTIVSEKLEQNLILNDTFVHYDIEKLLVITTEYSDVTLNITSLLTSSHDIPPSTKRSWGSYIL